MSYERHNDEDEVVEIEMTSISSSDSTDSFDGPSFSSKDRFISDSDEYFGGKGLTAHVEDGDDVIVKGFFFFFFFFFFSSLFFLLFLCIFLSDF